MVLHSVKPPLKFLMRSEYPFMCVSEILRELRQERIRLEQELSTLNTAIDHLELVERGRQGARGRQDAAAMVPQVAIARSFPDQVQKTA